MFVLHVPAVAAIVAAVLLGNWQIDAWQTHRQDRSAELADATPVPLHDVLGPDDVYPADAVGRPVTLSGAWLPESRVFVADRLLNGEEGYWMVVPIATCGSAAPGCAEAAALPVVLGWTRDVADAPSAPEGTTELTGWLQPGEAAEEPDGDAQDDVLPSLRIAELLQRLDEDVYSGFVVLQEPAEARSGLEPVTPESLPDPPTSTALRNLLYGIEWWFFAGFAAFLWWRWTKDEVDAARSRHAGDAGDAGDAEDSGDPVSPVSSAAEDETTVPSARLPSGP
jgi:cytochrome oxidase assembly protein ShyY1